MALPQSVGQSIAHQRPIVAVSGHSKQPDRREGAVAAGVDPVGQSQPDVEPAARPGPAYARLAAELVIEGRQKRVALAAIRPAKQLGLAADAFPVDVHLRYQVRLTPPPGEPPADPMLPTQPHHIASYRFPNLQEVGP